MADDAPSTVRRRRATATDAPGCGRVAVAADAAAAAAAPNVTAPSTSYGTRWPFMAADDGPPAHRPWRCRRRSSASPPPRGGSVDGHWFRVVAVVAPFAREAGSGGVCRSSHVATNTARLSRLV